MKTTPQPFAATGNHMAQCPDSNTLEWGTNGNPDSATVTCRRCGNTHEIVDL